MGSKVSKSLFTQHTCLRRRRKHQDAPSPPSVVENSVQSLMKIDSLDGGGDCKNMPNTLIPASDVKISPASICSKTSGVELSPPSVSTLSTDPIAQSEIDLSPIYSTADVDSVVESQDYPNGLESIVSTPLLFQKRSQVSTSAAASLDLLVKEKNKHGRFECHFWVPETALNVFTDRNDRRLKSIARSSGCSIELTDVIKLDAYGIPKHKVLIRSVTTFGMAKCRNLIEARFPDFIVKTSPVTPEVTS